MLVRTHGWRSSAQSWVLLGEQTGGVLAVLEGLVSPKGTSFVTCTSPFSPARLQVCSARRLCVDSWLGKNKNKEQEEEENN